MDRRRRLLPPAPANSDRSAPKFLQTMEKGLPSLSLIPLPSLASHWMQGHSHEPGGVMG